ncbi:MAG: LysE family translocator [Hoeflea sp.]|uniref:LysE family translocator n=1 Tax=Hoeflea sp. TaxID=1940281 RepID=UPI001DF0BACE|nr:LysE family translocator [Hoeflea sp.]MBU4527906.1 LysE family translocator [Alphaproteobacteria bacterium]MBU4546059.1 LysE family translocator [Alphaproteobacteria bacterium]MBU4553256.1 LysE family translocator [Alphaproteobacteria bacterium]MBV1724328.1 LysE family translocator [Hoeflea sp.]MBV1763324.1 LysE family translocator [Hoeflea sp.]
MTPEFLITTLIVVLLPGTGVIYTLAAGLTGGARAAGMAAVGCTLGIVPHVAASVLGLAALMHTSALAFQTLKYLGVLYLFYMAWQMWRDTGGLALARPEAGAASQFTPFRIAGAGILINLLNPKLTLFFLAFMPQFVDPGAVGATTQMLGLAGVFMAVTFIVFVLYGLLAAQARDHVISRPRVLRAVKRSFASMFALMGLRLALAER